MNYIDIALIIIFIGAVIRGAQSGSVRQILSTVGFFAGLFLGAWIGPHIVHFAHTASSRSWLTLLFTFGCALIFLAVGEYLGIRLKSKLIHRIMIDKFDSVLGAVIGGITLILIAWFLAAILVTLPFPSVTNAIRGSYLIAEIDKTLPPTPNITADLSHVIAPNGFPKVFVGAEPTAVNINASLPNLDSLSSAVNKDEFSVVKVEGNGCGGVVEGSGFVVSPGVVVTNAHVVAGVDTPYIIDNHGQHQANVIWFDPNLDLAVLTASNLAGSPLPISVVTAANSTPSVVLGFPGGGNFSAAPALVLNSFTATGRNIYNQGQTNRSIYEVKAKVIPGNSGGPLVDADGTVIGIIFAESTTYNNVGYALTMQQPLNEIHQALKRDQIASTGVCAS
jgi:S1-C subfamily serine protease